MEGRTIEYRPDGGGLDYHHSPLMAEIPVGENYTHIHRSIEHLRSMGSGMLDPQRGLGVTDLRRYDLHQQQDLHHDRDNKPGTVLKFNDYKGSIHDLRSQENGDLPHRAGGSDDQGQASIKGYSAPSTPLSENGQNIQDEKVWIFKLYAFNIGLMLLIKIDVSSYRASFLSLR